MAEIKKPRLFMDCGDMAALIVASEDEIAGGDLLAESMRHMLSVFGRDSDRIVIYRKMMTDAEVEALPDL